MIELEKYYKAKLKTENAINFHVCRPSRNVLNSTLYVNKQGRQRAQPATRPKTYQSIGTRNRFIKYLYREHNLEQLFAMNISTYKIQCFSGYVE